MPKMKRTWPLLAALLLLTAPLLAPPALGQQADTEFPVYVSTDAGNADTLAVGIDSTATSSIDPALGETEQPPPPPGFDARLVDDDVPGTGFGEGLAKDYRYGTDGFDGTREHQVSFQGTDSATEVTIEWDMPSRVTGTIEDKFGGDIYSKPMSDAGSITVAPGDPDAIMTLGYDAAQTDTVGFIAGEVSPVSGDSAEVPITVEGFQDVTTFQYTLTWDPAVATFSSVQSENIDGLGSDNFGTPEDDSISAGTLTVSWNDPDADSVSLSDGTQIFGVMLEASGSDSTGVSFGGDPTPKQVTVNLAPAVFESSDGELTISDEVSVAGSVNYSSTGSTGVPGTVLEIGSQQDTTGPGGGFSVPSVPPGQDYTLSPSRSAQNASEGVTTADILKTRWQILGLGGLETPFQKIAADANGSSSVTTLDALLVRQLILGVRGSLPTNTWRFVPTGHTFTDSIPFGAPSVRTYTGLSESKTGQSFTAVKRGDTNESWSPGGSSTSSLAKGPGRSVQLGFSAAPVSVGDTALVALEARDVKDVAALQFSLDWPTAKLSYLGAEPGGLSGLSRKHFTAEHLGGGQLAFAWTHPEGKAQTLAEGEPLLTLKFLVRERRPTVALTSAPTGALAYDGALGRLPVRTQERTLTGPRRHTEVQLTPARPNPSAESATIEYVLPEAMRADLRVYDLLGQVVATLSVGKERGGTHKARIDTGTLASGQYLLRLETPRRTIVRKMTVVK
jgi:hypothetical protein